MKFLVDAQLPHRLADWLNLRGHDAIHTLELPQKNRTTDPYLLLLADQEQRVLISKDTDFAISCELGKGPHMLLLVSVGNVHNDELLSLFSRHEATICELLEKHHFVELTRGELIVHS